MALLTSVRRQGLPQAVLAFSRRDDLLPGITHRLSPDMNVNFRRTSSSDQRGALVPAFGSCWERFRYPRAIHLRGSRGLYDVSVRSLAAWTGHLIAAFHRVP